jgi:hypothetical protein
VTAMRTQQKPIRLELFLPGGTHLTFAVGGDTGRRGFLPIRSVNHAAWLRQLGTNPEPEL